MPSGPRINREADIMSTQYSHKSGERPDAAPVNCVTGFAKRRI